jgi:hypothetical protein
MLYAHIPRTPASDCHSNQTLNLDPKRLDWYQWEILNVSDPHNIKVQGTNYKKMERVQAALYLAEGKYTNFEPTTRDMSSEDEEGVVFVTHAYSTLRDFKLRY